MFFLESRADISEEQLLLVKQLLTDLNTANRSGVQEIPIGAKTGSMANSAERSFDTIKSQNSLAEQERELPKAVRGSCNKRSSGIDLLVRGDSFLT